MGYDKTYEKLFIQDSIDKKRIGKNVANRASRRGYIKGGIKFPSDFLSAKEKKKLNGDVKVSNMYEEKYGDLQKVSLRELRRLPNDEYIKILTYLKKNNSVEDLAKQFNMQKNSIYNLYSKLGIKVKSPEGLGTSKNLSNVNINKSQVQIIKKYLEITNSAIDYSEFSGLNLSDQKEKLGRYINLYSRRGIAAFWGKDKSHINYLVKKLDLTGVGLNTDFFYEIVERNKHLLSNSNINEINTIENIDDINPNTNNENNISNNSELLEKLNLIADLLTKKEDSTDSLPQAKSSFEMNGDFSKEELEKRLLSISYILSEESNYDVSIVIKEL